MGGSTQMRTVWSLEADAMNRLSEETSMASTRSVCPEMRRPLRLSISNTRSCVKQREKG